jgi:hypothetical protein
MRVYVNLDNRAFVVSPTLLQEVSTLYFTRRDVVPVEVQFVRNGAVVELAAGATGQIGIKKTFAGGFLANDSGWTKTGTGTSTIYQFDLNLNTTNLNNEFPLDTEEAVSAKVEVEWTVSGTTSSTLPTGCIIYNDVIRGTESVPTVTATGVFRLQSPDNSIWNVSIENDGTFTATKT